MQEKGKKFAYIKNFYYLCTRFLKGVLRTPDIERFLQLDYSDVGWRIHSAPIEHPFSIHWEKVETTWKGGSAHLPRIQSLETDEGGQMGSREIIVPKAKNSREEWTASGNSAGHRRALDRWARNNIIWTQARNGIP